MTKRSFLKAGLILPLALTLNAQVNQTFLRSKVREECFAQNRYWEINRFPNNGSVSITLKLGNVLKDYTGHSNWVLEDGGPNDILTHRIKRDDPRTNHFTYLFEFKYEEYGAGTIPTEENFDVKQQGEILNTLLSIKES